MNNRQLTKDEAIALFNSGFWKTMTHREIAEFQTCQNLLCVPFPVYHEAMEKTLGRPVYTHEFGLNRAGIEQELMGHRPPPTFAEIVAMIPADKRIIVSVEEMRGRDGER